MRKILAGAAMLLAAACSPAETPEAEAPAAPQGLMEQAAAMSGEEAAVFAYTTFMSKAASLPRPCVAVRETLARGVVPSDVAPGSVYAPFAGAMVFAIQCGPLLTTVRAQPEDRWLLALRPGAAEAEIVPCVGADGQDGCRMQARPASAAEPTPEAAKQ